MLLYIWIVLWRKHWKKVMQLLRTWPDEIYHTTFSLGSLLRVRGKMVCSCWKTRFDPWYKQLMSLLKGVFIHSSFYYFYHSKKDCFDEYPEHRYKGPFKFSTLLICCHAKTPCASSNGNCCVHTADACHPNGGKLWYGVPPANEINIKKQWYICIYTHKLVNKDRN